MTRPSAPDRKVVLLTGASGQIGTAFCGRFATTYDIVAIRHRRSLKVASQLQEFVDPFTAEVEDAEANRVFEITADLGEDAEVARVVEVALARFGQIDVLVNTVGAFDRGTTCSSRYLALAGPVHPERPRPDGGGGAGGTRLLAPPRPGKCGTQPGRRQPVPAAASVDAADRTWGATFGATKAAQNMLSLRMAEELRPFNVRVVTVAPAPVPEIVTPAHVVSAIGSLIEGDETGRLMLMWDEEDEVV